MIPILLKVLRTGLVSEEAPGSREDWRTRAPEIQAEILRMLGRALVIRQVDAGSCNACELEINALSNSYYDIERFGLRFVASPRHADVLLVTGPVTRNMRQALERTYDAMPGPKWVVAAGDCAGGCGLFTDSYACVGRVSDVLPVDLHIPGCPPTPVAFLSGLISLLQVNAPGAAPRERPRLDR